MPWAASLLFTFCIHALNLHLHNRAYVYKLSFEVLLVPTSPLPLRFSVGSGWEPLWMSRRDNLSVQHESSKTHDFTWHTDFLKHAQIDFRKPSGRQSFFARLDPEIKWPLLLLLLLLLSTHLPRQELQSLAWKQTRLACASDLGRRCFRSALDARVFLSS